MHENAAHTATGLIDAPRLLLADHELLSQIHKQLTESPAVPSEPRPTIGGVAIDDLLRDEAMRATVAASMPTPTEEWVLIGRISIWQRAEAYTSFNPDLVTCFESTSPFGWNVAFADGHVSFETPDPEAARPAFINRDAPDRAEYGQPPLPAEWFVLPPRR